MEKQSLLGRTAMTLAAMMLTAMTAWAQEVEIILRNDASQYVYCGYLNKVKPAVERVIYGEYEIDGMSCTVSYDGDNNRAGENAGSVRVTLPNSYGEGIEGIKYFTITKAPLTVTAGSDSKYYDGTPLTCNSYTVEGLVGNDTEFLGHYSATVTGSQTKVGTSANVPSNFTFGGYGYEANYDITYVPGTLTVTADPADWADNGDGSYTIGSEKGWDIFCDALLDNDTYNRFSGKTVKLGKNISVTRMAGSASHDFCGTFDGQGNTLTFTSTENVDGVAPFSYISETTPTGSSEVSHPAIRNLNVVVDINTSATHAGGLVGRMWGTLTIEDCTVSGTIQTSNQFAAGFIAQQNGTANITDCVSSVTIKSSVEGDGTHGGFVAVPGGTLNITGSAFTGKLITTNGTTKCGGFVGWYNGKTVNVSNSLYDPADLAVGETAITDESTTTFVRGGGTFTNSYYTATLGTKQGKAVCPAPAAPVGNATHAKYSVSGITPYASGFLRTLDDQSTAFYYGGGDNVSAPYVDEDGNNASHEATALSPTHMPTTLDANFDSDNDGTPDQGWYYVADDITYTQTVTLDADVNIILADGKAMNVGTSESPISSGNGINGRYISLTIYGQTLQSGTLNAYNSATSINSLYVNIYNQHGGTVTINATNGNALSLMDGDLTLSRGTLTANSGGAWSAISVASNHTANVSGGTLNATGDYAIHGNVTFSGGNLTATGRDTGIFGKSSTLSWTSPDDRITVSSFVASAGQTVTIATGHAFHNGSEVLAPGTVNDKSKLNGKTLTPAVILADNADNNTAIATAATVCTGSKTLAVKLAGRTLYKDGAWNTLCLPFTLTIANSPLDGDGVDVRTLSSSDFSNGTLTLTFTNEGAVTTMEAGKPYIIKWNNKDETLTEDDLVFENVTMSSTAADVTTNYVDFCGTFSPEVIYESGDEKHNLYLGGGNTLYYPTAEGFEVNSCRAYFVLKNGLTVGVDDNPEPDGGDTKVRAFNLSFGDDDDVTGILSTTDDTNYTNFDDAWYDLSGRKLSGKPSQRGVYIRGGRKIAVQ